jgi:hypothetical protein
LVDYSSITDKYSLEHQVLMASIHDHAKDNDKLGREYDNELLVDISGYKNTNAPRTKTRSEGGCVG